MQRRSSLLRTIGSIGAATGLSRVLGLVRDQVTAYYFGAGSVTDAFYAAFRVPNLLRDLFAEGVLSSAFVPTLTAVREKDGAAAGWRLVNRLMTALLLILGVITGVIALFAPWILEIYAAGFDPETRELAVTMTRIVAPFLLFVALAAVAMGALNTCGRFFLPALAPASFNLSVIVAMIVLWPVLPELGLHPGLALPIGAIAGGAMQLLVQIPALRREGFRFRPELAPRDPGLRRIAGLMLPATFGLAATQINILVDTILASQFLGAITFLTYGFRLMQLPLGLFGVAIGTANLQQVSLDVARSDLVALRLHLAGAFRAGALLTLPATAGLIALRQPIVRVIFEHGRFTADSTSKTAAAVLCYALGLYAYALTKTQVPTLYALGDRRSPVIASAIAVASKIAASFMLLAFLPTLGLDAFLGLAISTSLAAWINFAVLARVIHRRVGSLREHRVVPDSLKLAAISIFVGLAALGAHSALEQLLAGGGFWGNLSRLAGGILVGLVSLVGCALALDLPETRQFGWRRGGSR